MAKQKEIKFRRTRWNWEGRQDGVIYRIFEDRTLAGTCAPSCSVNTYDTKGLGREIDTAGHRLFHRDDAMELCQKIAAGEIDMEAMRTEIEAEDQGKERAVIRDATERAKKFRTKLETAGISYAVLLTLEAERDELGDMAHNILLGHDRGEGWPAAADKPAAEREPVEERNLNWAIHILPEDCRSLFVFADAELFDKRVKDGVIPLHDDRERKNEDRIPCFIGYAATQDLKCLDILAGVRAARPGGLQEPDHCGNAGILSPTQKPEIGQG